MRKRKIIYDVCGLDAISTIRYDLMIKIVFAY